MGTITRLVIHGVQSSVHPKLRTFVPDDPAMFDDFLAVLIGYRPGKGSDEFAIRVATPAALAACTGDVVAQSPLLVLQRFDYDVLWAWIERTVESCRAETWPLSVERLQRHFAWEFASARDSRA
jgi:hypothetical protein